MLAFRPRHAAQPDAGGLVLEAPARRGAEPGGAHGSGLVVLAFGVYGLVTTPSLGSKLWNGVVAIVLTPPGHGNPCRR